MYAELIGNYKKQGIKSPYDNKIDGRTCRSRTFSESSYKSRRRGKVEFQDFGYWRDSRGYLHKGVIPKKESNDIRYAEFRTDREAYDPFTFETSDTRYHSLFIQEGLYGTNTYQGIRPSRI